MKMEKQTLEGTLTAEFVDKCSEMIRDFLTGLKLNKQNITKYCLSLEEILLDFMNIDCNKQVKITTGKKLHSPFFSVEIDGKAQNVFVKDGDHSFLGDTILSNLNLSPEYVYQDGKNQYTFKIKSRKLNPFFVILLSFSAAILTGIIGNLLPNNFSTIATDSFVTPVYDAFINILSCLAGPMIFLSVAYGVYGIGDVATLKRVGKKVFFGFIITLYCMLAICSLLGLPFFSWNYVSKSGDGNKFSAIFTMILQIFPSNIVSPFAEGNTLQIIFLAFIIGIALIFLGKKTDSIVKAIEQINYIIIFITEIITKIVPFFIYIVLLKMIWTSTLDSFLGVWKMFIMLICESSFIVILIIAYTAIKNKVNAFTIVKKGLPTYLTALTTASSSAAFAINIKASSEDFGINKSVVAFSIPLGMVLFKMSTAISYVIITYYFAEFYAVEVSVSWFILVLFTAGILSMATPPITGGAIIAYTILFTQFGIPIDALALTLACDVFFDFINTGFNQFLLPFVLINQTEKLNLVDLNVLRKKKTHKKTV